jgi:AcrR family transcriptional regulator
VLLYLFGSKDDLIRALLARARTDELALLNRIRHTTPTNQPPDLADIAQKVWGWLAAPERRGLLTLWVDGYARSPTSPTGPGLHLSSR